MRVTGLLFNIRSFKIRESGFVPGNLFIAAVCGSREEEESMQIRKSLLALLACLLCALSASGIAQSLGSAGTVGGTVTDPAGAVIAGATVVIQNSVTGYRRTATTDATGTFRF